MKKPIAVITGDDHFTVNTLEIASRGLIQVFDKAIELNVPVLINGDLLDGKSLIQGVVANRLIDILDTYRPRVKCYINTGNHDLLNERNDENSALIFLDAHCSGVITQPTYVADLGLAVIPYRNTKGRFIEAVLKFPKEIVLAVHQGIAGAMMGDYLKDVSSVSTEELSGRRVIASHYHRKQDIGLPEGGLWSYVGSLFSVTAGEAQDGPKGFCVLYTDGTLEHIPTNLRKHVTIEIDHTQVMEPIPGLNQDDLLWMKVRGTHSELEKLNKRDIGLFHLGHSSFKLDKLPEDSVINTVKIENLQSDETLDFIIDSSEEHKSQQIYLKSLWREILE